jgi:hypothetical protein
MTDRAHGKLSEMSDSAGQELAESKIGLHDAERWAAAQTLADLGELTALWLEGTVGLVPGTMPGYGPDEETTNLIPILAASNRAGLVTIVSQPGEEPTLGSDGELWTQRAAVEGFASADTLALLRAAVGGTALILMAVPAGGPDSVWETQIPVTLRGEEEVTWFGSVMSHADIADEDVSFGICHPDAVNAICESWQVTIIDPEWGRNDLLSARLEKFATHVTAS